MNGIVHPFWTLYKRMDLIIWSYNHTFIEYIKSHQKNTYHDWLEQILEGLSYIVLILQTNCLWYEIHPAYNQWTENCYTFNTVWWILPQTLWLNELKKDFVEMIVSLHAVLREMCLIYVSYDHLRSQRLMILSFVENRIFMRPFVF